MKLLLVTVVSLAVFTADARQELRHEHGQGLQIQRAGEPQLSPDGSVGQGEAEGGRILLSDPKKLISATQLDKNQTQNENIDNVLDDQQIESEDMETLLGRSRWCKRRGGQCTRPNKNTCDMPGYQESPMGRPYCTSKHRRCCYPGYCDEAEGFFKVPGSVNQCFKYFNDSGRSWSASKAKCEEEGLRLANPRDPCAVRKYLVETFGNTEAWIGARGTGSSVNWDHNGKVIDSNDNLWYSGTGPRSTSTRFCLLLLSFKTEMKRRPYAPYYMHQCTGNIWYALCELAM